MNVLSGWLGTLFYSLAQWTLPGGRLGRAMSRLLLRRSLAFAPHRERTHAYLNYLQGVQAMERGDPETALRLLRRAARALPGDPAVRLDAAVALTISGKWDTAETALLKLLQEHPQRMSGERQLWFALAWSQLRLGRHTQALQTARQAAEAGVGTPHLRLVTLLAELAATGTLEADRLSALLRSQPSLLGNVLEFAEQLAATRRIPRADSLVRSLPPNLLPHSLRLLATSALNTG